MSILDTIFERAKADKKRIVLPEGDDARVFAASAVIAKEGIAEVILLGVPEGTEVPSVPGLTVIDTKTSPELERYAQALYEKRKHKGMTLEDAMKKAVDPIFFGTLMIMCGDADGLVAGAAHSTADTIRPALQTVKTAPGVGTVSGSFIMETPAEQFGHKGVFVFADCAINIEPTAEELASTAIASADTAKQLAGIEEPYVAMLSYSTKGSAKGAVNDKMREAMELVKKARPDIMIDGELQADAAIVESVGATKCPGSPVAGKANVLVFPDLQSGNIAYKLVERLSGGKALGPICQGLARPINDLSRGCSMEDVVAVAAITAVQAQGL